jgi:phosphonate transport system permease protein
MVTIFMALLATTIGTIAAAPLSFLAASNITRKGPLGTAVYYLARSIFNVGRSFEPLVMALIFALIVGFGSPFAGVLGMTVMTAASLGKMFSESVESIDPGPIEAVLATGANRWQVVRYAVVPQIIPDFLSFIIYHWDINVRISTIIGFVGGGGIGYYLSQRISTLEYSKAGTGLMAIVIVVWVLDFLSAQIRKRAI